MNKNYSMQGLRGFSALIVVIDHIYQMAYKGGFFHYRGDTGLGYIGVDLFFMISGFLIIQSLIKHGEVNVFLKNRVIRVFPVFLFLHFSIFLAGPIAHYEWFGDVSVSKYIFNFFSNLFLLPGMFDLQIAQKNAWSLSYEFAFYLMACALYLILNKVKNASIKGMLTALFVLSTLAIMYIHPRVCFFIAGVLVFFLIKKVKVKYNKFYLFNGTILLLLLYISLSNMYLAFVFGVLFFFTIAREEGVFSSFLKTRVMQFFGDISYSFYLWHPFALFPFKVIFSRYGYLISNEYLRIFIFGVLGFTVTTIVSYLSYKYIEVWFTNKYLKRSYRQKNNVKNAFIA